VEGGLIRRSLEMCFGSVLSSFSDALAHRAGSKLFPICLSRGDTDLRRDEVAVLPVAKVSSGSETRKLLHASARSRAP
jgi:hypothetical protein